MGIEISSEVKIRFNDCDPLGHLNSVKYLDYMLNAREDHVEENYGFTYEEYLRKTGCTWIAIQNEIAYLKEVKYNQKVIISSKTIEVASKTAKIEILMKSLDQNTIHSVLWVSIIYFNLKTRSVETHPEETVKLFDKFLTNIEQKDFQTRVQYLRQINKKA